MKSPQISGRKGMQRFLAGAVIGAFTAWLLYFYMHGTMQEEQILTIREQQKTIENLKRDIEIWKKEAESLNEETEEQITVHEIQVTISNFRDFKLDLLSVLEAQEEIRKDLSSLLTKDLETVYKGKLLIRKTIENKTMEFNNKKYTFEVSEMMFYSTIYIEVKLKRS